MENLSKEVLEEELEKLTKDYEVITSRIEIMSKTLTQYKVDAVTIKGAINQTKKLLAFINNEETQNKNIKEEEKNNDTNT